jgi:glutamate racemase
LNNNQAIGIFDSGVGGLSVWKELIEIMPNESFLYFADSANCPYGSKTQEEIIALSKLIVDFFISKNVKMIVVACNTATAAAIDYLRQHYNLPFIGMEPAIKPAALNTKKGIVGVLATEGTFNGRLFNQTSQKYASDIQVEIQVGEGFVELVERGKANSIEAKKVVSEVLKPLLEKDIDQLVLACTHYPFLCDTIKEITQSKIIEIINPAPSVARHAKSMLVDKDILADKESKVKHLFFSSSSDISTLQSLVSSINDNIDAEYFPETIL